MRKYDGIFLYSGGLDSILAYRLLSKQNLKMLALKFHSVFFPLRTSPEDYVREQRERFGVEVELHEVTDEFLPAVKDPRFGYGRWMNPCLDCKLFMYRFGARVMREKGAKFIATGEVLGQRPMTQHRGALRRLEKEAGLEDRVLRPLCAKLLNPTRAELSGFVDRDGLLDVSGRGRRRQISLAVEMGVTGYPSPAGGCLLTDETFARRLKDLLAHDCDVRLLPLLLVGRHFRISGSCRIVVGRNRRENQILEAASEQADLLLEAVSHPGPNALIFGTCSGAEIKLAAAIIARYGDAESGEKTKVKAVGPDKEEQIQIGGLDDRAVSNLRI